MRIPPEKIDEIRNAIDIVDLIGSFVPLKKRGKSYIGICPFHQEKTASFNVSPERQMYHCFGCGVGGNVISFVMEFEKVSFVEAVRSLAEKAGINLPVYSTPEDEARASEQEELYQICREAGLFFYKSMMETAEGKFGLEYFRRRGFSDETIRTFGLGYSLNSWDAFLNHGISKNYSIQLLEKAGLIRMREDRSSHDYFRGRAMFPIFSAAGRVVGFGARKIREEDPLGKYLNSPETLIYNKSKILYGLFQAKEDIRDKDFVILVEGYADLISIYQAGIKNVVASSGTALTQEQIQLIGRYTKNITIMYDADSAGSKAALRGVDLVLENDLDVRVAPLPDGEDPDSFVRMKGGEAFRGLIDEAISFVDFIAQAYERDGKLKSPEGQAQTVRAIVQTIAKMKDELKRNFYLRQVAEKYRLYESTLFRELEKNLGQVRHSFQSASQGDLQEAMNDVEQSAKTAIVDISPVERDILHAMLEGGIKVIKTVSDAIGLEDFAHPQARSLFELIVRQYEEGIPNDPSVLMMKIEDELQRRLIAQVVFSKYQLSKDGMKQVSESSKDIPEKVATDGILILRRRRIERLLEENQRRLRDASRRGDDIAQYLEDNKKLNKEKKELSIRDSQGEQ